MKPAIVLAIALVTLSSLPVVSHRNDAEAQEIAGAKMNQSASRHRVDAELTSSASAAAAAKTRPVKAELVGKLEAKTAKTVAASGPASGTLSAADRNVHLDSGSQLVLGLATAKPK